MTPAARLQRLESQRQATRPLPVAIVNVCDMTPTEAAAAIAAKRQELRAEGYAGTMIILDD